MRGQAYTLEALISALLLISALTFALQVTAVTPLSASTSNQHIENQQRASAAGALTAAQEADVLKEAVLFWNESEAEYHRAERVTYYTNKNPPNEFGDIMNRSFGGRGLAVNVLIYPEGNARPLRMIYRGEPSDNAVSASQMVTLYEDDNLTEPDGNGGVTESDVEVQDAGRFKKRIPAGSTDGDIYSVVRVEVTVWRM